MAFHTKTYKTANDIIRLVSFKPETSDTAKKNLEKKKINRIKIVNNIKNYLYELSFL